jgi:hypothetical protein
MIILNSLSAIRPIRSQISDSKFQIVQFPAFNLAFLAASNTGPVVTGIASTDSPCTFVAVIVKNHCPATGTLTPFV